MSRARSRLALLLALSIAAGGAGCGVLFGGKTSPVPESASLMAVMPLERAVPVSQPPTAGSKAHSEPEAAILPRGAQDIVTAQIYGVLAARSRWRVVPDLTVSRALRNIPKSESLQDRARALGKAVKADVVLYGTVSRFRERVGSEYGSREPASVSFKLSLLIPETGKVVWSEAFNQTQKALSSNLLDWWMFWRAGPHWFSAQELSRLGVEKLIDDLDAE